MLRLLPLVLALIGSRVAGGDLPRGALETLSGMETDGGSTPTGGPDPSRADSFLKHLNYFLLNALKAFDGPPAPLPQPPPPELSSSLVRQSGLLPPAGLGARRDKSMENLLELVPTVWEKTEYPMLADPQELWRYSTMLSSELQEVKLLAKQFKAERQLVGEQLALGNPPSRERSVDGVLDRFVITGQLRVLVLFIQSLMEYCQTQHGEDKKMVTPEEAMVRQKIFNFAATVFRLKGLVEGLAALAAAQHPADVRINEACFQVRGTLMAVDLVGQEFAGEWRESWKALLADARERKQSHLLESLRPSVLLSRLATSLEHTIRDMDAPNFPLPFADVYENVLKLAARATAQDDEVYPVEPSDPPAFASRPPSFDLSREEQGVLEALQDRLATAEASIARYFEVSGQLPEEPWQVGSLTGQPGQEHAIARAVRRTMRLLLEAEPWHLAGFLTESPAVRLANWVGALCLQPSLQERLALSMEELMRLTGIYGAKPCATTTPCIVRIFDILPEVEKSYLKAVASLSLIKCQLPKGEDRVDVGSCRRFAALIDQAHAKWYRLAKKIDSLSAQLMLYRGEPFPRVTALKNFLSEFHGKLVEMEQTALQTVTSLWSSLGQTDCLKCIILTHFQALRIIETVDRVEHAIGDIVPIERRQRPLTPQPPEGVLVVNELMLSVLQR